MNVNSAKEDRGKLRPSLVPTQVIKDIAEVREYGVKKYHDPDNWKKVELQRYVDAFYRHWLAFVEDANSVDEESGLPHYKHCACNMAFICEMMKDVIAIRSIKDIPHELKQKLIAKAVDDEILITKEVM